MVPPFSRASPDVLQPTPYEPTKLTVLLEDPLGQALLPHQATLRVEGTQAPMLCPAGSVTLFLHHSPAPSRDTDKGLRKALSLCRGEEKVTLALRMASRDTAAPPASALVF